ncbi:putative ribosomal protein L2, domain 2 [Helianthus debilis subsp. tardiflorus]
MLKTIGYIKYIYIYMHLAPHVRKALHFCDLRFDFKHSLLCASRLKMSCARSAWFTDEPSRSEASKLCLMKLPSGSEKLIDTGCRATIGVVSNLAHGQEA